MKCNSSRSVLWGRLKSAELLLLLGVGEIVNDQPEATPCAITARAAILKLFRHVDGTMQPSKRGLIRHHFWWNILRPDPLFVFRLFAFSQIGRASCRERGE